MGSGPVPRVVRRLLDWDLAPVEVLRLVRADAHPAALLGIWADGTDVIGSEPVLVRSPPHSVAEVLDSPGPDGPAGPGFGGGWIGYLGFGYGGEVLPVPPAPGGPRRLPVWWFGYYDHVLCRDRSSGKWFFEALWTADRAEALERRFEELCRRAQAAAPPARGYRCGEFVLAPSPAEHKAAVGRAVDYIWRGDIFQANICLKLEASFDGDPLDAFCQAAGALRPPYAAFIRLPGGAVASLSPELFVRRTGRAVVTRPVKGTHARSADQRQAARQRAELEHSAKDRAENVMIVDLMRNDLSRACAVGSVEVPRLLAAEPHPGVWHLVSEVRGTLRPSAGDGDLIRAAFPPGSVTGAPKVRAVEIIHELEATPREIYTGAVGYRSPVAGLELNVAIRTFEFCAGRVWLGSGGGIVADSAADGEYAECLLKAGPLISAIGGHIGFRPAAAATQAGTGNARDGGSRRPRPAARIPVVVRPRRRPASAGAVTVLIDNYDSFTYNLAHMLAACGCAVEVVLNDEVTAAQVASFGPAGVVISPGPCTPAEAGISVDVVRACGGQMPVLGVCLGHQAIAAAFGAQVVPAPRPVHGQTSAIAHDGRGVLAGLPQPFQATRYHSLMVDRQTLPACLTVTATAEGHIPMGLRHATQPTEGVQFHPESILTTCGQAIIRNFAQTITAGRIRLHDRL